MTGMYKIFAVVPLVAVFLTGCNCCNKDSADNHGSLPILGSRASRTPSYAAARFIDSERSVVVIKAHQVDRDKAPEAQVVQSTPTGTFRKPGEQAQRDYQPALVVEDAQFASVRTPATEAPLAAAPKAATPEAAKAPTPLELQYVHEQWDRLPEAVKTDVLTIIKSSSQK